MRIWAFMSFGARDVDNSYPIEPGQPESFSTMLPNSPLSYEGHIIKFRWCVRVRAFPVRGREVVGQRVFQLGSVPPSRQRLSS